MKLIHRSKIFSSGKYYPIKQLKQKYSQIRSSIWFKKKCRTISFLIGYKESELVTIVSSSSYCSSASGILVLNQVNFTITLIKSVSILQRRVNAGIIFNYTLTCTYMAFDDILFPLTPPRPGWFRVKRGESFSLKVW